MSYLYRDPSSSIRHSLARAIPCLARPATEETAIPAAEVKPKKEEVAPKKEEVAARGGFLYKWATLAYPAHQTNRARPSTV